MATATARQGINGRAGHKRPGAAWHKTAEHSTDGTAQKYTARHAGIDTGLHSGRHAGMKAHRPRKPCMHTRTLARTQPLQHLSSMNGRNGFRSQCMNSFDRHSSRSLPETASTVGRSTPSLAKTLSVPCMWWLYAQSRQGSVGFKANKTCPMHVQHMPACFNSVST